jgi:tetratricopeptide (TPR) repeat protein
MGQLSHPRLRLAAALLLAGVAAVQASPDRKRDRPPFRDRGGEVGAALLVRYYQDLPERRLGEKDVPWALRLQKGLNSFKKKVAARYSEAALRQLLGSHHAETRRAAVIALGLTGTMDSNAAVAAMLHDDDAKVRRYAADALVQLWFRADKPAHNRELRRLVRLAEEEERSGLAKALVGLTVLIRKAPRFAEAYNQRAVLYFEAGLYAKAVKDCQTALKLNPYHYLAANGMAHAYLKLKDPRAAVKAFRTACRINPDLEGARDQIQYWERLLGEDSRK